MVGGLEPLEIMRKNGQRLFSTSTPVLPLEDVIVGPLADQEVGHVSAIDLFGLDVKEHNDGRLHSVDGFGQIVSERVVGM